MGDINLVIYYFLVATIAFIVVLSSFIIELRIKVEFNQLFPLALVVLGIVMFYCIGYFVGLKLDSLCPPSFPNSSKDIGFAGLSIFAIGGSLLSSNISLFIDKTSQFEYLPTYIYKVFFITDFVTWSVIFGIISSFIMVILILNSLPIISGIISVLFVLMIIFLAYIYIIFIGRLHIVNFDILLEKIFYHIKIKPLIYFEYYKSGFFRHYITKLYSNFIEPSEIEKKYMIKHQEIINLFATPYNGKIGKYKKPMDFKTFQLYLDDLNQIFVSIIDNKKDVYWIDNQILKIISIEIREIVNTNHFYLQIHAYSNLLGTLLSRFEKIQDLIKPINSTKGFDKPIFVLLDYIDFHSSISIDPAKERNLYKLTYQLALLEVILSEITVNYCNYLFSESADYSDKFNETVEYSLYIIKHFFSRFPSELKDNVAVIVYMIGMYALLMNSTQFRSWDVSIHQNWKDEIKRSIIDIYLSHYAINQGIASILEDIDKSLNIIEPKLFNYLYIWSHGNHESEDVSFKFIAGLLVIIDEKKNQVEDFNKLTQFTMRNLSFSKEQITSAIDKTLKIDDKGKQIFWEYSNEMIDILNKYNSK